MLPEKVIDIFTGGDRSHPFAEMVSKLDRAISTYNSSFYGHSKDDISKIITDMLTVAYTKGREDEAYYSRGPSLDIYQKNTTG